MVKGKIMPRWRGRDDLKEKKVSPSPQQSTRKEKNKS